MATLTLKGVNRTLRTAAPPSKIPAGEERGRVHWYYDEYAWTTNSVIGDVVTLMTIPKGARVVDAIVTMNDNGTAGQYDIGYAASADGLEAVSAAAFFDEFNPEGTGGNSASLGGGGLTGGTGIGAVAPGSALFKKFLADVNVTVTVTEASNVGAGTLTIKVGIQVAFD